MEDFSKLPWWGQVVFFATNAWVIFILGLLLRQTIIRNHFHFSDLFTRKKTESANQPRKEYDRGHSLGYIDA